MVTISEIPDDDINDALPYLGKSPPGTYTFHSNTNTHNASIMELTGAFGAVDPVEAFYSHWPSKHHASLCIAKDSNSLRAIMAVINRKEEVECIVDSGLQIVSMLEEIAHQMGLIYNPTVVLNMQSGNSMVDQSQGLVHVISQPAYDILLGKSFDVLIHSIVRTLSANEIVIMITNQGDSHTIATFERGHHKRKPPPLIMEEEEANSIALALEYDP
ncbi:hypothetical protein C0995_009286 [Termitomyces sp. Mi166|nr:hypothetical protein C0995_009286 [Termitomyces sp. Mi166\